MGKKFLIDTNALIDAQMKKLPEKAKPKKSMADFTGVLSEDDYQSLKEHTEQARKE